MQKTPIYLTVILMLPLAIILRKLRSALEAKVPVGYQDESGFHVGVKSNGAKSWPSLW
ncbi:DUF4102 domain-containing protein [Pedosphaera parvula]|uniref:Uncharacterized protein n=1 Tax=Pedosphaera parvula (strain Ellin514) TaxID=320771 RepID=B9XD12_PEDPL|nr:DUF4102 domain-containing protein [Pedosphaera parvula]EEF62358.1 hypothetical protein Cflav_PD4993 [Pedosphaera parvula Ellin514]